MLDEPISQQMAIQYDFKNKINKFKGDNDYVEEEIDTSNDEEECNSADVQSEQQNEDNEVDDQYNYDYVREKIQKEVIQHQHKNGEYGSPLKQNYIN